MDDKADFGSKSGLFSMWLWFRALPDCPPLLILLAVCLVPSPFFFVVSLPTLAFVVCSSFTVVLMNWLSIKFSIK